jgi:hypothetical protein
VGIRAEEVLDPPDAQMLSGLRDHLQDLLLQLSGLPGVLSWGERLAVQVHGLGQQGD